MKMLKLFTFLTLLTGVLYPVLVTTFAQILFKREAHGSLVFHNDKIIGSALLAQKFTSDLFFHPRPSATDYETLPSGASQKPLRIKDDMLSTSASGLDPHISPESAFLQVERVAQARKMKPSILRTIVQSRIERPTLGIWGQPRVNVLELNMALVKDSHGNSGSASQ